MPNTKVVISALFACISSASWANCYDRDVLAGCLADRYEMTLTGWGLTDSGDMHELYQAPNGMWAVVQTTPARCSTFGESTPSALRQVGGTSPIQQGRATS